MYIVKVRSTDSGLLSLEATFSITVEDVVEATGIALSSGTIKENMTAPSLVGILTTLGIDATDRPAYTLVAGAGDSDNEDVDIDGDKVYLNAPADFEAKQFYYIRIRSTYRDGYIDAEIQIDVLNEPEPPVVRDMAISRPEDWPADSSLTTIDAFDPDGDITAYLITAGNTDGIFELDQLTGELKANEVLDF
ncbi:MAG: cadherin repeat domain-containing protein [Bacteroidia bacterium]|nr:cadherin repeat domain-containing protein [Bacteroidia bacterium]